MYCPKCGIQNPESGKFCRSCGTDLGNISDALSGNLAKPTLVCDRKGRPVTIDGAIMKFFTGLAFIVVAIALGFSSKGQNWWFWMLIPGFASLGAGVAQYVQLRGAKSGNMVAAPQNIASSLPDQQRANALPPPETEFIPAESRYKTGDLVPPSVTDGTTRHLEINREGETMALPKK